jgi:hypothetical protein
LEFLNCLAIIIINYTPAIKPFSGAIAREEKEDLCKGSFSHAHPLLCFIVLLYFILFYLHRFIKNPKKLVSLIVVFTCLALSCFLSMVGFFETKSFWQGGFTEEQQNYYEEHRLSQKGKHLWEQINRLYIIARNMRSTYNVTYYFDRSCCCRRYKHLPFQCEYNDDVTISSYINGNYDFYDVE